MAEGPPILGLRDCRLWVEGLPSLGRVTAFWLRPACYRWEDRDRSLWQWPPVVCLRSIDLIWPDSGAGRRCGAVARGSRRQLSRRRRRRHSTPVPPAARNDLGRRCAGARHHQLPLGVRLPLPAASLRSVRCLDVRTQLGYLPPVQRTEKARQQGAQHTEAGEAAATSSEACLASRTNADILSLISARKNLTLRVMSLALSLAIHVPIALSSCDIRFRPSYAGLNEFRQVW